MPPNGPKGGQRFNADWQPVIRVLWEELDREYWKEVAVTGPVQASKSFGALVVPTLRDVVELNYSPIVAVPEADMFSDKWDKDFKPVFEASADLQWLTPKVGSGVKGGRVKDRVTLANNLDIKVMSRGGQSTNKAGYTSPRLRVTEAAGFSQASSSDRDEEADAYRQLLGRLGAFGLRNPHRLAMIEGTLTIAEHLPWRLRGKDDDDVVISTQSRLVSPCPHCGAWISPERDQLVGWQDAQSMLQALEQAVFVCPECGLGINDDQRRKALQDLRIVHRGQEITPEGDVVGPLPETLRLFFRYSAYHNCLLDAGDTAVKEWEAAQIEEGTLERENAERDLCQKSWATPYVSTLVDNEPLDPKVVRKRRSTTPRNVLPADTKYLTVGRDCGKWSGYWAALAFRESGEILVPAYGVFDICRGPQDDEESRLYNALIEHSEQLLEGFERRDYREPMVPDRVWTDMNYLPDTVAAAIRCVGAGMKAIFQCVRGAGRSVPGNNGGYRHPLKATNETPLVGMQWHRKYDWKRRVPQTVLNSDFWIQYMQERLRVKPGRKGALTFFESDEKNGHAKFSHHLLADRLTKVWDARRGGMVEKWTQSGENHWGDCTKYGLAAGDEVGFSLRDISDLVSDEVPAARANEDSASLIDSDNWYTRMLNAAR